MKKIYLLATAALFSAGAMAELTADCEKFYTETIGTYEQQAKASGMSDADIATMKQQYEASKTQMAQMPKEQQDAACKAGLDALEQAKKAQAN